MRNRTTGPPEGRRAYGGHIGCSRLVPSVRRASAGPSLEYRTKECLEAVDVWVRSQVPPVVDRLARNARVLAFEIDRTELRRRREERRGDPFVFFRLARTG